MRSQPQNKRTTGHYFGGLLGIIPVIGFVAGLVILINSIIYYRDKWLALIGLTDMLLTIGFFFYISHVVTPEFKDASVVVAQSELNGLIKDIEYYKLQNGKYPDSLADISDSTSATFIYDPLSRSKDGEGMFNYEKVGEKYTVFSSGLDGKPYTSDDLYPQVNISDSTTIGFRRFH